MPESRGFHTVPPDVAEARRQERTAERERQAREAEERTQRVRRYSLAIGGALFMAAGFHFLTVAPGESGSSTVNLQRLAMGETFTIVGAILSGFAWRPKA